MREPESVLTSFLPQENKLPLGPPSSLWTAWLRAYAQLLSVKWKLDSRAGDTREGWRDNRTSDRSDILGHPAALQSQPSFPGPHSDEPALALPSSPSAVAFKEKVPQCCMRPLLGKLIQLKGTWSHKCEWTLNSISPISSDRLKGKGRQR